MSFYSWIRLVSGAKLAPQGRLRKAQGASPGNKHSNNGSPEGAMQLVPVPKRFLMTSSYLELRPNSLRRPFRAFRNPNFEPRARALGLSGWPPPGSLVSRQKLTKPSHILFHDEDTKIHPKNFANFRKLGASLCLRVFVIESLRSIFWSYDESGICHLPGSDGPFSTRSHCARTGAEESRDPGQRREAGRRRDPHHERAGPEVLLFLPQDRREETDVAHLLPAYYARRMAADDQADGQPEQTADRTGGRARRFEIPLQQSRARSRRGSTGRIRSGKADDRLQILRQRHGTSLQQVPLDGPRHTPTPHQGRMGAAGRHAQGLLSALGLPGLPPPGPAQARAWTGRAPAGQPAPAGKSCRPSLERFPAQDRG